MTDSSDQSEATRRDARQSDPVLVDIKDYRSAPDPLPVTFHRRELDAILRVYGRNVAEGEWRDYAIDHLKDKAVFSVFRRTSEVPLFRIEKVPRNARKQGAFSVVNASGAILKRGHDLEVVLRLFEKKPKLVRY
ncbi:DUF2794 domain-containing protein [Pararhizobium haloflavum]|uniref:DUF2794 domain-containing protein n=1 Tax=Pararhizobium haloflavum TaxID=2037914 RepID=UPI000C19A5D7|nr:DUF2794 domain-containing protein [Pararhizobium haloflavum]